MTELDGNKNITVMLENFKIEEAWCPCCHQLVITNKHFTNLQAFRNWLFNRTGKNIRLNINSAYRCEKHNKEVGGVSHSQHLLGNATDIWSPDIDIEKLYQYAKESNLFTTIIFYSKSGFIHVDSRDRKHPKFWKWFK